MSIESTLNSIAQANTQKMMDWQKMMSDTSHQREVTDLKKAGLNPVLSSGGNGAQSYTTSVDSAVNALGGIAQSKISSAAAVRAASIQAAATRAAAAMNNEAVHYSTDNSKTGNFWGVGSNAASDIVDALHGKNSLGFGYAPNTRIGYNNPIAGSRWSSRFNIPLNTYDLFATGIGRMPVFQRTFMPRNAYNAGNTFKDLSSSQIKQVRTSAAVELGVNPSQIPDYILPRYFYYRMTGDRTSLKYCFNEIKNSGVHSTRRSVR